MAGMERVFRRIEGEGWLVLAGAVPELGGETADLMERLLARLDLSRPVAAIAASGTGASEVNELLEALEEWLGAEAGYPELDARPGGRRGGGRPCVRDAGSVESAGRDIRPSAKLDRGYHNGGGPTGGRQRDRSILAARRRAASGDLPRARFHSCAWPRASGRTLGSDGPGDHSGIGMGQDVSGGEGPAAILPFTHAPRRAGALGR